EYPLSLLHEQIADYNTLLLRYFHFPNRGCKIIKDNASVEVVMNLQTLLDSLSDLTPNDRSLIERAYNRAEVAHAGQFRKSGEPYLTHCIAVAQILADMKLDAEAVAAALLHDTLEDTSISLEELRSEFGDTVASLVDCVSKLNNLPINVDSANRRNDREL